LLPTVTLPKLRLVGFDPNAPAQLRARQRDGQRGIGAVEVMVTLPLTLPADAGVSVT